MRPPKPLSLISDIAALEARLVDLREQAAMQEKRVTDLRTHADMVGDLLIAVARQDAEEILRAAVAKAKELTTRKND